MVSGENPGIRLLDKEGGKVLTAVSYWRIYRSPVGPGHICYVTVGTQGEPGSQRIGMFANEKLYDYMTNEVVGLTNKAYKEWPYEKVGGSTFPKPRGDALHEVSESCTSLKYKVELAWHDLQPPEMLDIQARPGRARTIHSVSWRFAFLRRARTSRSTARRRRA